jgi:hypothetical protein
MSEATTFAACVLVAGLVTTLITLALRCIRGRSVVEDLALARNPKREGARLKRPKQPRTVAPKAPAPAPSAAPVAAAKVVAVSKARDTVSLSEMVSFYGAQKSVVAAVPRKKKDAAVTEGAHAQPTVEAKPGKVKKGWHVVSSKRDNKQETPAVAAPTPTAVVGAAAKPLGE